MSHFTKINTKIKERPYLIEALELLGHDVQENQELVITNPSHAENHPVVHAEVAISNDVGFRWNEERFVDKVTQQYARVAVYDTVKEMGFQVQEEWEMDDNSIEITATRWV